MLKKISNLPDRLKDQMYEKRISQRELADKTGIPEGSISHYINNRYAPKQDRIDALARALDVSPVWLMGYDVNKRTGSNSISVEPHENSQIPIFTRAKKELSPESYEILENLAIQLLKSQEAKEKE